jgi:hypothetical protein
MACGEDDRARKGMRSMRKTFIALALVTVVAIVAGPATAGGRGGGKGGGKGGNTTPTGSFSLVLLDSTDGVAHWGQRITFDATSTAKYFFVAVSCYRDGVRVYRADKGFYVGWPWSKEFYLQSYAWTGGAADCDAELYSQNSDGSNRHSLATMSFPVAA